MCVCTEDFVLKMHYERICIYVLSHIYAYACITLCTFDSRISEFVYTPIAGIDTYTRTHDLTYSVLPGLTNVALFNFYRKIKNIFIWPRGHYI